MASAPIRLSELALRTPDQPISHFMKVALENPKLISLAAGFVDEDSLPTDHVSTAMAEIFSLPATARAALQYGSTQGHPPLRAKVLDRIAKADGVTPAELGLTINDVVISTGSQQLLYMIGELLLDPGDIVITEAPSYFVYHAALASRGVEVLPVPMDEEGMDTEALAELLQELDLSGRLNRLKMIYTIDYFQNPSGRSLSARRRVRLVDLVKSYSRLNRIFVLEDAAYRELRFAGDDIPSIKSLDPHNEFVIYTSTFSKPLSPGLKTGFGLIPTDLREPLLRIKGSHDFGSANFSQHLIDRLIETGSFDEHIRSLREVYRAKCQATTEALAAEFREWPAVKWTQPDGGLYVWLMLPPFAETGPNSPLMQECLQEGVLYVPGEFCHVTLEGRIPSHEIRLCYGVALQEQIREAVRRLARAVKSLLGGKLAEQLMTAV